MGLIEKVRAWEIEKERRRGEREQAERLSRLSEGRRTSARFRELLGEYIPAMRAEGVDYEVERGMVLLRANGRVMEIRPALVGNWVQWGTLTFPVSTEEEVCDFFSTVFFTLRVGGDV